MKRDFNKIVDPIFRLSMYHKLLKLVDLPPDIAQVPAYFKQWYPVNSEEWARVPIRSHCGFFQNINFGTARVDFIVATWSLYYAFEHSPRQAFDLLSRLVLALRPGGKIWIDDMSILALNEIGYQGTKIDEISATDPMSIFLTILGSTMRIRLTRNRVSSTTFEITRN